MIVVQHLMTKHSHQVCDSFFKSKNETTRTYRLNT